MAGLCDWLSGRLPIFTRPRESARKSTLRRSVNRAILAKLFTQPANLLVLDEPTNDLDIETLELLEEVPRIFWDSRPSKSRPRLHGSRRNEPAGH